MVALCDVAEDAAAVGRVKVGQPGRDVCRLPEAAGQPGHERRRDRVAEPAPPGDAAGGACRPASTCCARSRPASPRRRGGDEARRRGGQDRRHVRHAVPPQPQGSGRSHELIGRGKIGKPKYIVQNCSRGDWNLSPNVWQYADPKLAGGKPRNWRFSHAASGGTLNEFSCHYFDLLHWHRRRPARARLRATAASPSTTTAATPGTTPPSRLRTPTASPPSTPSASSAPAAPTSRSSAKRASSKPSPGENTLRSPPSPRRRRKSGGCKMQEVRPDELQRPQLRPRHPRPVPGLPRLRQDRQKARRQRRARGRGVPHLLAGGDWPRKAGPR